MYNGIGLRTVRGSGTNGYVQRNLSYVNASRTRQTLARNQRSGGSSGDFGARKNRPPPNADILLHEQKRKVELQLLEMSLEMEDRDCDPEEIQDKVKRERERLLARLNGGGGGGRDKTQDAESSHARQKRKEEENKRIKDAFGIATDYVAGESFDPEMQEQRRQERKEQREQEWKEREEARQQRLKQREESEDKMKARRERFRSPHSRPRSARRSRSPPDRRSRDRRSRGRDDAKLRLESKPHSPVTERRSRLSSSTAGRKHRSVSSSSSGSSSSRSSSRSRSRSRNRKARTDKRSDGGLAVKKKKSTRSRSPSSSGSSSSSGSGSGSDSDRGRPRTRGREATRGKEKEKKLSVSVLPARSAVLKGEHKILNLSGNSAAVANAESSPVKKEGAKSGAASAEKKQGAKKLSPEKKEVQRQPSPEKKTDPPLRVKSEKSEAPRSPRRSRSPAADTRAESRKRKLRSASPKDGRRGRASVCHFGEKRSSILAVMSSSAAAATAASSAPSTSVSIADDVRPFLSDSGASSSSGGLPSASTASPGGCARALRRRFPRVRRCLARVSLGLPTSGAAGGLTVIMALLMVGIVGTFALHQMMSPEIEALTHQREKLKDDVAALRLQVDNMTRIAESRLETIHLLETELERQHVQAAEAAATATTGIDHNTIPNVANEQLKSGELRPSVVLPTIFYSLVLGSVVLASVLYRIFLIIRGEIIAQQKLGKKQYVGDGGAGGLMMPSVSESSMDGRRTGRGTPPLSPTRGPIVDDSVSNGRSAASSSANSALSPTAKGEPSPQCYKRAPGSSPTIV
ncbi:Pre-mRNA-splicing factor CWC21 [Phytophthora ramorum]|uniref:Pre-mRNA-splicing factor CWC21 n=1 Tax=Phytophthora ramorum TaxID=164328 RepID=UPI0030B396EB|nr:Pre-mRNA-splicing factor CWC21 [Phytophthora ramorum]